MVVFWNGERPIGHRLKAELGGRSLELEDMAPELLDAPDLPPAPGAPSASVVICTRDRPEELARCLASLPRQSRPPREIIVVDNASRDGRTREAALAAGVTYVREDRPGLDIARNAGARAATCDIVAYTDDDVVLHPRWLERLVAAFDAPEVMAVTGLVLPAELASEAQLQFETFWSFGQGYRRKDFDAALFSSYTRVPFPAWDVGAGASMAFRRALFAAIGLFDERLDVGRAGCSGDSEFWYRALAAGHTCRYEPSAVAFHYHRREMDGLKSQIFHYMRGHAAALLVQNERTRLRSNLKQALYVMPRWLAARAWRRLHGGAKPRDRFLDQEIAGYLSGLWFYLRQPRARDGTP
ncbi:MAG: glycosyltransferase [Alphaproteobacteria bacterium]|nr:glycosyltransferase [Alphaproteobacteria bacterium]